jgi:hypothetical protein
MDWTNIISAILAGGLAGQLTTVILGQRFQAKREKASWMRSERFRVFSELLALVSAYASREDVEEWPEETRVACQKVHLLASLSGDAPAPLSDLMQRAFELALQRKLGGIQNMKAWRDEMRELSSDMRRELAAILYS